LLIQEREREGKKKKKSTEAEHLVALCKCLDTKKLRYYGMYS